MENKKIKIGDRMKRVIVETPYAGDIERNTEFARKCLHDCLLKGEAPLASHLLYTQPFVLDDDIAKERTLGINAGLEWGTQAETTIVYIDYGISGGMKLGIDRAEKVGRPVEYRTLSKEIEDPRYEKIKEIL